MALKKMKVYYYWPVFENEFNDRKIIKLDQIFEDLKAMPIGERVYKDNGEIVQLKKIESKNNRWYLSFMKLKDSSPFKTTLEDEGDPIELEGNEFIGEEVCAIYDAESKIISIQNNRYSLSYSGMSMFLSTFMDTSKSERFHFEPLTYPEKYTNISDELSVNYKSIHLNFMDITKLMHINRENDLAKIAKLAHNLNALSGKIEFGVGRTKDRYLIKESLKVLVDLVKKDKMNTKSLKVKMMDGDTVRLIDLINYKLEDEISINISKDDPKTFDKILLQMDDAFNVMLKDTLNEIPKKYVGA